MLYGRQALGLDISMERYMKAQKGFTLIELMEGVQNFV